jgi:hypothetical protein
VADGRWVLHVFGYNVPHKYPRRLWKFARAMLIWPKGGGALDAAERGEFATIGLFAGPKLRINALTRRGGSRVSKSPTSRGNRSQAGASTRSPRNLRRPIPGAVTGRAGDLGHPEGTAIHPALPHGSGTIFGWSFSEWS